MSIPHHKTNHGSFWILSSSRSVTKNYTREHGPCWIRSTRPVLTGRDHGPWTRAVCRRGAENGRPEVGRPENDRPNCTKNGRDEIGRTENGRPKVKNGPRHKTGRPQNGWPENDRCEKIVGTRIKETNTSNVYSCWLLTNVTALHCVSKKTRHQTLAHNFPKC